MQVAVVILNWNGKDFLQRFLPNVIENTGNAAEVIIADNGSTDDSIAFLQQAFPQVRCISFPENMGFSKGYNKAIEQIDAEYCVLLNSDVEVTPGWIEPVIALMEADKQIAVCQPKLLAYHDKSAFEYAGAAGGFIDRFGYPFCRGRIFQVLEKDIHQYDDDLEVFWASGAAFFVRTELYKKYGGLDDDFFAHMEEIDFCWRMKTLGYKIMYTSKSVVYHVGGGALPKENPRKTYLNFRNNLFLLYKNLPPIEFAWTFLLRVFLDLLAVGKFLLHSKKEAQAVCKAYVYFFKNRRLMKDKQCYPKRLKSLGKVYNASIVWDYYVLKRRKFSDLYSKDFQ